MAGNLGPMQEALPKPRPPSEVLGFLAAVAIAVGLAPALAIATWMPATVPLPISLGVGLAAGLALPAFLATRAAAWLRRRGIKMGVQKVAGLLLLALLQGGPVFGALRWGGKTGGDLLATYKRGIELFARPAPEAAPGSPLAPAAPDAGTSTAASPTPVKPPPSRDAAAGNAPKVVPASGSAAPGTASPK